MRRSVGILALMIVSAQAARAQSKAPQIYRVMLSSPNSPMVTIADFRPCVAGDSARCGAWLEKDVNTSLDHAYGQPPGVLEHVRAPNGAFDLSFAAVAVRVKSLFMPDSGRYSDVKVPQRTPKAIAMSPDSRYAFAVFASLVDQPPQVCMIDLNTRKVVATLDTKTPVLGIGVVP
jgi:hypothetical protein